MPGKRNVVSALSFAAAAMATVHAHAADAESAREVRGIFLFQEMFFEACGRLTGDKETYREVGASWRRRNFYHGDVADRVLAHHGASYRPDRTMRDANAAAIRITFRDVGAAAAYCALSGLAVGKDSLNIPKTRPDLFEMLVRSDRVLRAKAQ